MDTFEFFEPKLSKISLIYLMTLGGRLMKPLGFQLKNGALKEKACFGRYQQDKQYILSITHYEKFYF